MVCAGQMGPYFTKKFNIYGLDDVEYWHCLHCGLVMSKTHKVMGKKSWNVLNKKYHQSYQGTENDPNDPRWILRLNEQAEVIADLKTLGLITNAEPWVDYGCGDGKLSDLLLANYGIEVSKYDKNKHGSDYLSKVSLLKGKYGLVISTSVFEHISNADELGFINKLVSESGVLAVHTFVGDMIQPDPNWFYLLPTHCTFFTNKSMQMLFDIWEYQVSLYHVNSRLWFWFKNDVEKIEETIRNANNREKKKPHYHFKRGFVDYWK